MVLMHGAQQEFYKSLTKKFPGSFVSAKVLEIGSLDINGTIRQYFANCDYIGVDVGEGPCVDVVAFGQDLDYADGTFDHTTSSELMEHCVAWKEVFANMHRMTKKGGLVSFTCAWGPSDDRVGKGRPEHGTTRSDVGSSPLTVALGIEYYENRNAKDFEEAFDLKKMFKDYEFIENDLNLDLYFLGVKK
jgi:SAM-dependent methyltransferase